jgi:penicillin-binding protein 1B
MSVIIELKYGKDEILEIYLNEIYLGQKGSAAINGVGEAGRFYFAKAVSDLSLTEAATLAGLIKSPGRYSPYADKAVCRQRRDAVLQAMFDKDRIGADDLKRALALPVEVNRSAHQNRTAPYFIDYLARQLETLYSPEDLSSLGLSIYTTLDTRIQAAAETALENGLDRLVRKNPTLARTESGERLQGAVVVIQPKTGYILAMVGGRDYAVSQYNRIVQSRRQPGSAFKPFVYLAALERFTPASRLSNAART